MTGAIPLGDYELGELPAMSMGGFEMVEAAGVEPASGNLQQGASTCIAAVLILAPPGSRRQDPERASLLDFAPRL